MNQLPESAKALCVKQPWAWLIVNGYKPVENRSWNTTRRGRILIHAGQSFDHSGYQFVKENFPEINLPDPRVFEYGGIVGQATITDVIDSAEALEPHDRPWFSGPRGFLLKNACPTPFQPCRGMLGFFQPKIKDQHNEH